MDGKEGLVQTAETLRMVPSPLTIAQALLLHSYLVTIRSMVRDSTFITLYSSSLDSECVV